jgi:hypothetical protein
MTSAIAAALKSVKAANVLTSGFQRPDERVDVDAGRDEEREQDDGEEEHADQRQPSDDLDVERRRPGDDRQLRAPGESEDEARRQSRRDRPQRDDRGEQQPAPARSAPA